MEHSLEAYLSRLSTEILCGVLWGNLSCKESAYSNRDLILMILRQLEKRCEADEELAKGVRKAWDRYTQYMAQIVEEIIGDSR